MQCTRLPFLTRASWLILVATTGCRCGDEPVVVRDAGTSAAQSSVESSTSTPVVENPLPRTVEISVAEWSEIEGDWLDSTGVAMARFSRASSGSEVPWILELFDGVEPWTCGVSEDGAALCKASLRPRDQASRTRVSTSVTGSELVVEVDDLIALKLERVESE